MPLPQSRGVESLRGGKRREEGCFCSNDATIFQQLLTRVGGEVRDRIQGKGVDLAATALSDLPDYKNIPHG